MVNGEGNEGGPCESHNGLERLFKGDFGDVAILLPSYKIYIYGLYSFDCFISFTMSSNIRINS